MASECVPLVKTGGLADVVGALPAALTAVGWDMRVLLPAYRALRPIAKDWPVVWEEADLWGGPGRVLTGEVEGGSDDTVAEHGRCEGRHLCRARRA